MAFYIPSKNEDGIDIAVDRPKLIEAVMKFLLIELGGATQTEGIGYFLDDDDVTVHVEHVTVCKSFCSVKKIEEQGWNINRMANSLAIEFKQVCISVELDGEMLFYGPTDEYKRRYALPRKGVNKYGYEQYINADLTIPEP